MVFDDFHNTHHSSTWKSISWPSFCFLTMQADLVLEYLFHSSQYQTQIYPKQRHRYGILLSFLFWFVWIFLIILFVVLFFWGRVRMSLFCSNCLLIIISLFISGDWHFFHLQRCFSWKIQRYWKCLIIERVKLQKPHTSLETCNFICSLFYTPLLF